MPRRIPFLGPGDELPPSSEALEFPNGLLAAGGELTPGRLLAAYRRGIFPWYEEPQPVLWWTPDPRSVLFPGELHISRSLRKVLRRDGFALAVDTAFARVMAACAGPRRDTDATWIGREMLAAYIDLHRRGYAHSIEVLDAAGELVGGLYGVAIGAVFFGESMFSHRADASKVALVGLVDILRRGGFGLIDCQVGNPHLESLGARDIDRLDFEALLAQNTVIQTDPGAWSLPGTCGALL
ncbi:MAG: leucyl/phenylalanyl-tRNA--protein transferase [Gammaproteobacteria bacterium]|nr:leucyl/phenylalanyl-tRNA--protein transferase [Gammaproteobacteria bacterium]